MNLAYIIQRVGRIGSDGLCLCMSVVSPWQFLKKLSFVFQDPNLVNRETGSDQSGGEVDESDEDDDEGTDESESDDEDEETPKKVKLLPGISLEHCRTAVFKNSCTHCI